MLENLKSRTFWNGLLLMVLSGILYFVQEYIPTWEAVSPEIRVGLSALVAYLIKYLITPDSAKIKAAEKTLEKLTTEDDQIKRAEAILTISDKVDVADKNSYKSYIVYKDDTLMGRKVE